MLLCIFTGLKCIHLVLDVLCNVAATTWITTLSAAPLLIFLSLLGLPHAALAMLLVSLALLGPGVLATMHQKCSRQQGMTDDDDEITMTIPWLPVQDILWEGRSPRWRPLTSGMAPAARALI